MCLYFSNIKCWTGYNKPACVIKNALKNHCLFLKNDLSKFILSRQDYSTIALLALFSIRVYILNWAMKILLAEASFFLSVTHLKLKVGLHTVFENKEREQHKLELCYLLEQVASLRSCTNTWQMSCNGGRTVWPSFPAYELIWWATAGCCTG